MNCDPRFPLQPPTKCLSPWLQLHDLHRLACTLAQALLAHREKLVEPGAAVMARERLAEWLELHQERCAPDRAALMGAEALACRWLAPRESLDCVQSRKTFGACAQEFHRLPCARACLPSSRAKPRAPLNQTAEQCFHVHSAKHQLTHAQAGFSVQLVAQVARDYSSPPASLARAARAEGLIPLRIHHAFRCQPCD